jgi:dienelactone hydrolase
MEGAMTIRTRDFTYEAGGVEMAAHLAWDDAIRVPVPGILVTPTVRGPTDFEQGRAAMLADLGYAALVIDMYGLAPREAPGADMFALMNALNADRRLLQARMAAALDTLQALPEVDAAQTAAIGFCFGGKCILDLARTRSDVRAVAAFHGLFDAPPFETLSTISAKVLALHGWDDPLATPEAVNALAAELTARQCDWQIHAYGNTGHAFTFPPADDREKGMFYQPNADRRSWAALTDFLAEQFG